MKKVPKMISTKDFAYISDMFNWNMIIAKKVQNYIDLINDEEIINEFDLVYNMHISNCEDLVKILEGEEK